MKDEEHQALLVRARAALGIDASAEAKQRIEEKLERLASSLALEWLVGDRRFESQSQQTEHWLAQFYEELYSDEQPDPTRIYERFGLSLPRASYIARLLRARRVARWRKAAQVELKATLERNKKKAEEARDDGQAHIQEFDVSLSAGAADELRVLYDRIAEFVPERERPKPPRGKPGFGAARWIALPAETLLLLLDHLEPENGK